MGTEFRYLIYKSSTDNIILCGDFNARCGNLQDSIIDVDEIPSRLIIDTHLNQNGKNLIEFLQECKFLIVNGRVNHDNDDFTCKTSWGCSVVDFVLVPHHCLVHCTSFSVKSCSFIIEQGHLQGLISNRSRVPDHSLLLMNFKINDNDTVVNDDIKTGNFEEKIMKHYNCKNVPDEFLGSFTSQKDLYNLMLEFNVGPESREYLDECYRKFRNIIQDEMNIYLTPKRNNVFSKSRTHNKVWNDNLEFLWVKMRKFEKRS